MPPFHLLSVKRPGVEFPARSCHDLQDSSPMFTMPRRPTREENAVAPPTLGNLELLVFLANGLRKASRLSRGLVTVPP